MKNDNIQIFDLPGFAAADGFVIVTFTTRADFGPSRRERMLDPKV